ncbi:MAG: hypothetical protein J6Y53_02335 [Alphaproteobacteria bacterium]|nr:hypothetical protein [Alphaproteobacteria bacterium]
MYLWVVIAIFLSALAALSSSLRPDIKELYLDRQAEAEVTQLYVLHRAVMKYFTYNDMIDGEVDYNKLEETYLPFGFNRGNFSSYLYCLDEDGYSSVPECKGNDFNYIITYGPIARKWQDNRTGLPRAEILDSMRDKLGYVDGLGYSVDRADNPYMGENDEYNTFNTRKGVVSQGTRPYYSLPEYIIGNNRDFGKDNGMCSGNGNYCLVYITKIQ